MIKTPTKNTQARLEKLFTIAGLLLLVIGCSASLFGIYTNWRFITDNPATNMYYLRYFILLVGGFALGYLFTKNSERKLFGAIFYAVLTTTIWLVIETVRIVQHSLFTTVPSLISNGLFLGGSAIAVIVTLIVACISRRRYERVALNKLTKITLIGAFLTYELFTFVMAIYFLFTGELSNLTQVSNAVIIGSLFTQPLIIAITSYLLLRKISQQYDRVFYAALIGAMYSILSMVAWELRIDASADATDIFNTAITLITLALAGLLLWRTRQIIQ